jgi:RimJ/RimL family protein N-acetyltransferase/DNA-binding MarR family transcriptional regulator
VPEPRGPLLSPGFWLHHAALEWRQRLDRALRPLGLTPTQFSLLGSVGWLDRTRPVPPTQQQVAEHAGADRMMASKVLRTLEERGLVTREPDPDDARSLRLRLTGDGRRITSQAVQLALAVDEELFGDSGEQLRGKLQEVAAHRLSGLPPPTGRAAGIEYLTDGPSITAGTMTLPAPTLHTARLRLRPFGDADADDLFVLHSNVRGLRYWDSPPWSEPARAGRFIAACRQMAQAGTGVRLAVDRAPGGTFIGWCSLNRWNPDYRSASLGYCFDEAAWGHGYATEAARALLRWAFDTLDLNRVQAETDTRNVASARVLEKLGFVREGTLREDCVVNGEVSDSWVYGLVRREWQPSSEPVPAR